MQEYSVNIGLEVHIQLNTASKAFCQDSIEFGQDPNTQTSAISLAYPGTLPKTNKEHVHKAVQLALAMNSEIQELNYFDRKSYFYPDLPKGYQITQDNAPYCKGGHMDITLNGKIRRVHIHHIHMEEDAGKSIHDHYKDNTVIDLNRAGTPLLELVTEPCIESAEEAHEFLTSLRALIRYLGISDGNMEQGSMRADCNVSIRPSDSNVLGERCEIKNVNSRKFAKKAIEYEIQRQTQIVSNGGSIKQTTMDFDSQKGITIPLRDKEEAHDYRYFPDPDLPPLTLTSQYIDRVRKTMLELPWKVEENLIEKYGINLSIAKILAYQPALKTRFESQLLKYTDPKKLANLYLNKIIPQLQSQSISIDELPINDDQIVNFLQIIDEGKVSSSKAYQNIFPELLKSDETALEIAQRLDLIMKESVDTDLESLLQEVLKANPDKVKAYKNGKKGLIGFFMGQSMKAGGGKFNPQKATELLQRLLDNQ